jgi:hypothetical protein
MSDVEMNTPELTFSQNGTISKIPLYHGDRKDLEDWLLHCDLHFHKRDVDDDAKPLQAVEYLRGDAFKWVKPFLLRYMDDNDNDANITLMFEDWTEFKRLIKQAFGLLKETAIAEHRIQNIRQEHSAADYANKFRQYSTQVTWNDDALRRMYKQGLKAEVRTELMRTNASTDTLDQLIDESIRLDTELYQLRQENKAYGQGRHERRPNQGKPRSNYVQTRQTTRTAGYYTSKDPERMHIDAIERNDKKHWKVTHQKDGKGKTDVTCYGCGKKGHFARDCRSKNKVVRHINVIGRGGYSSPEDDTDPWEVIAPMEEDYELVDEPLELEETLEEPEYQQTDDVFHMHPGKRINERTVTKTPEEYLYRFDSKNRDRTMKKSKGGKNCSRCRKRHQKCERKNPEGPCDGCERGGVLCTQYHPEAPSRDGEPRYDDDYRNPTHATLHFRFCTCDYCDIHYDAKAITNYFPIPKGKCKWQWFDCEKDICKDHLWDKRTTNHFPGQNNPDVTARSLTVNNRCFNDKWQICMSANCKRHENDKLNNGFEELSFLERNKQLRLPVTAPPTPESDQGSENAVASGQDLC